MFLFFRSDNEKLERAARIASSDIRANFMPYKAGLLDKEKPCIMAGIDYDRPWTRDTAINTCFALAVTDPDVARNTLMAVCAKGEDGIHISGQYWDKVIWILGARQYITVNRDTEFIAFAAEAAANTLREMEEEELDPQDGLFRGPAVYGDGVAAYPDRYAKTEGHSSGILEWPGANPDKRADCGYGIPMKTLSTNIIYCEAYRVTAWLLRQEAEGAKLTAGTMDSDSECAAEYANKADTMFRMAEEMEEKAELLRTRINASFWNPQTGRYDYLIDSEGRCDHSEALGLAFAILFGIADQDRTEQIIRNTKVLPEGIPVLWPSFDRYRITQMTEDGRELHHFGRHSGTIWPHAQAYWALAMKKSGHEKAFCHELCTMAEHAIRDMQFAEIYHPETGEIYGGMQEPGETGGEGIHLWKSCEKQTWSATGFWALLLYGIFGISYEEKQIRLTPYLPEETQMVRLDGLQAGGRYVSVVLKRDRGPADPDKEVSDGIVDLTGTELYIPLGKDGACEYEFTVR